MKVVLRQDYNQLGKEGDILDVAPGYARNFLIPKNIAYIATKGNLKTLEYERKIKAIKFQKEKRKAEKLAVELEKVSVTIPVQVGEEDKIFGSVTAQMIADQLKEKGYEIDKRKIEMDEQIKTLGIYNVKIRLYQDISATIKVWVVKE